MDSISVSHSEFHYSHTEEPEPRGIRKSVKYYFEHLKPQYGAICAGLLTVIYGGLHLGWGIFNDQLFMQEWLVGEYNIAFEFFIVSWFIGVIVGCIFNCFTSRCSQKKKYYFISLGAVFLGSILITSMPENINALIAGRLCAGLSYGVTYPMIIIHASEISTYKIRGLILASVHFFSMFGIFLSAVINLDQYLTLVSVRNKSIIFGIIGLVISISGAIINYFLTKESPIYWLRKDNEQEAMRLMLYYRAKMEIDPKVQRNFDEIKQMLTEDQYEIKWRIFSSNNWRSLLVVVLMRVSFFLSFNYGLNSSMLNKADFSNNLGDFTGVAFIGTRLTAMFIAILTIDVSRKNHLIGNILSGVILLVLSVLIFFHSMNSVVIVIFSMIFQITSGSGLGIIAQIYSGEAFNTTHKPVSISFAITVEYLLQIIVYHIVYNYFVFDSQYVLALRAIILVTCGLLLMAIGKVLIFYIPETAGLTLREARNKFIQKRW